MKVNNPYNATLAIMRRQGSKDNPPTIRLGTVISPPPSMVLKMGDLQIDNDNILISDFLLSGYQREAEISDISAATQITLGGALRAGDVVAVLSTADRQTYVVLCKVVHAGG